MKTTTSSWRTAASWWSAARRPHFACLSPPRSRRARATAPGRHSAHPTPVGHRRYVSLCLCVCVCVYAHVHVLPATPVGHRRCVSLSLLVCVCACLRACVRACVCVCACACVHACVACVDKGFPFLCKRTAPLPGHRPPAAPPPTAPT